LNPKCREESFQWVGRYPLLMVLNATFNNISVYRGGQFYWWRTLRKPPTCRKSLTNYHIMYTSPWSRFELTTSVVIGTYCIDSCKSNHHTIMATAAPRAMRDQTTIVYFLISIWRVTYVNVIWLKLSKIWYKHLAFFLITIWRIVYHCNRLIISFSRSYCPFFKWDTLSWFWAYQSLLLLCKAACWASKAANVNFIVYGLTRIHDLLHSRRAR
jgi:hypothetical protein